MIRAENGELRALVIEIESALSDLPRIETESETADSDYRGKPDDGLFSLRENVGDFIFESRSAEFSHTTGSVVQNPLLILPIRGTDTRTLSGNGA